MATKGRKPDYDVSALNKDNERKGKIGAAWANPDGTISIVLNTFIVLDTGRDNLLITMFPTTGYKPKGKSNLPPDSDLQDTDTPF